MKRHSPDIIALLFGLAFLGTGAGFIVHETTGHRLDPTWVSAIGFLVLGSIALIFTLLRGRPGLRDSSRPADEDT